MIRTQIQLPDSLYREVQELARAKEWSLAETMRRGAEALLKVYPAFKEKRKDEWKLPAPLNNKLLINDHKRIKEMMFEDYEAGLLEKLQNAGH